MATKQRLVVCLDGTWNIKDSTTNVLHHFNLVVQGPVPGGIVQRKHYEEGVGTGTLDYITGGGFGVGLEANVRKAYDWLVQFYQEADEIFIMGFSRGAYTARSLVGFIAACGLLRRGVPLTVDQLWDDYCILGRERESHNEFWDKILGKDESKVRRINSLVLDPWSKGEDGSPPDGTVRLRAGVELNESEELLVQWSRRVRITYLGLYDTVGAIGWDALAIPGLKSRVAMHNNMRPTTIIKSCHHALALDENRSSFSHTPFVECIGQGEFHDRTSGQTSTPEEQKDYWGEQERMWRYKIHQQWFVGAHSNIGGGYPDNTLAQKTLAWVLEGAQRAGLVSETVATGGAVIPTPPPNDSYAEFVKPIWTMVLRGKRNYRIIAPEPRFTANRRAGPGKDQPLPGWALSSIAEKINDSVYDYWGGRPDENPPPNLVNYARRSLAEDPNGPQADGRLRLAKAKITHLWFGEGVGQPIGLIFWATLAAVGVPVAAHLFWSDSGTLPPSWWGHGQGLLGAAALFFALVDWAESRVNFSVAAGPEYRAETNPDDMQKAARRWQASRARWQAFLDAIYWMRALGVVLAGFGAIYAFLHLWSMGWFARSAPVFWTAAKHAWIAPLSAGVGVVLGNLFDGKPKRWASGLVALLAGPLAVVVTTLATMAFAWVLAVVFAGGGPAMQSTAMAGAIKPLGGQLLLLQLGYLYYMIAFFWVGEPMGKAGLGSEALLQICRSPKKVMDCFARWQRMLGCRWRADDPFTGPAARMVHGLVREALWRDIMGFIPVYSMVLGFGAWLATRGGACPAFAWCRCWFVFPMAALVADYVEDTCHFRYVAAHEQGREPPGFLVRISFCASMLKFLAYFPMLILTVSALLCGSWKLLADHASTDWRGKTALLITLAVLLAVTVIAALACGRRIAKRKSSPS